MSTIERLLTAEEYARLPDNGEPTELVRGRIVKRNFPDLRHGWVCMRIASLLAAYVDSHDLGRVVCNNAGIITKRRPDTVRGPDISFFSYARIPKGAVPECYAEAPPEIVFEVRSPGERSSAILDRVFEFFDFGIQAVYVVATRRPMVTFYDSDSFALTPMFQGDDELPFPEPLGGLRIGVREIFS